MAIAVHFFRFGTTWSSIATGVRGILPLPPQAPPLRSSSGDRDRKADSPGWAPTPPHEQDSCAPRLPRASSIDVIDPAADGWPPRPRCPRWRVEAAGAQRVDRGEHVRTLHRNLERPVAAHRMTAEPALAPRIVRVLIHVRDEIVRDVVLPEPRRRRVGDMHPPNAFMQFGMTRIISSAARLVNTRSATTCRRRCGFVPK